MRATGAVLPSVSSRRSEGLRDEGSLFFGGRRREIPAPQAAQMGLWRLTVGGQEDGTQGLAGDCTCVARLSSEGAGCAPVASGGAGTGRGELLFGKERSKNKVSPAVVPHTPACDLPSHDRRHLPRTFASHQKERPGNRYAIPWCLACTWA